MTAVCKRPKSLPQTRATSGPAVMLTAADVATLLACSTKTVYRMVDRGAIPRPIRLGGLLRWRRAQFEQWLADGCPPRNPQPQRR